MIASNRIKVRLCRFLTAFGTIFLLLLICTSLFASRNARQFSGKQHRNFVCNGPLKVNLSDYLRTESPPDDLQPYLDSILPSVRIGCANTPRIGNIYHPERDGTYSICASGAFRLSEPCVVYSFGIGDDFAFEDTASSIYRCQVRAFDPTTGFDTHDRSNRIHFERMGIWDADESNVSIPIVSGVNDFFAKLRPGWTMHRFDTLRSLFNDSDKVIDILKFDVETSDIVALIDMLNSGSLRDVKQFIGEVHPRCGGARVWQPIFECLFASGFRVLHFEKFDNGWRYEFAMLNTHFSQIQSTASKASALRRNYTDSKPLLTS